MSRWKLAHLCIRKFSQTRSRKLVLIVFMLYQTCQISGHNIWPLLNQLSLYLTTVEPGGHYIWPLPRIITLSCIDITVHHFGVILRRFLHIHCINMHFLLCVYIYIYDISAKMFLYIAQPFVNILCTPAICEMCLEIFWYCSTHNFCIIIIATLCACILQRYISRNRAVWMFIFKVSQGGLIGSQNSKRQCLILVQTTTHPPTQFHGVELSIMHILSIKNDVLLNWCDIATKTVPSMLPSSDIH